MQTSYNGWPASKDPDEIRITSYKVEGTNLKIRCAEGCGPLLAAFAGEFNTLIEPLEGGVFDDWSYAYRMVRGSSDKLSNHSSGTALDLHATRHPLSSIGTFPPEKVPMIKALAKKYGLVWGGADNWKRKDEMHFEVAITPEKAKQLITKLGLDGVQK